MKKKLKDGNNSIKETGKIHTIKSRPGVVFDICIAELECGHTVEFIAKGNTANKTFNCKECNKAKKQNENNPGK